MLKTHKTIIRIIYFKCYILDTIYIINIIY